MTDLLCTDCVRLKVIKLEGVVIFEGSTYCRLHYEARLAFIKKHMKPIYDKYGIIPEES